MSLEFLKKLIGKWEGNCQTWFEPGKLSDESKVTGEIVSVFEGRFIRHQYLGSMQDNRRQGEELIAFNSVTQKYQISWVDDFHMNYAILFSEGEATQQGFTVLGHYDIAADQPRWGWKTEYQLIDHQHLTMIAYNITPDGQEAKATETIYTRIE
ncbi:MAG: hypothetical protein COA78_31505 [Blastopirellula sp.]|nr:MAG: hypothetical protein COA78_31505 [Blastopirellula sp.]